MMTARRLAVLLGLSACAYALAVRPRLLRWGATEEVRRPYPGSEFVPGGERSATMAVTIGAPPSQVWPWLVQMGCDRAGWYSWDRLDNGGVPSSEHIRPEWQKLSVSDHLASTPNGSAWFEVAALEPGRFLRCVRRSVCAAAPSTRPAHGRAFSATRSGASCWRSCRRGAPAS